VVEGGGVATWVIRKEGVKWWGLRVEGNVR